MTLRLAEAIRMGSLLIPEPCAGRADRCAIGMANAANGCRFPMRDLDDSVGEDLNWSKLYAQYPWLSGIVTPCPHCTTQLHNAAIISHLFDLHIMGVLDHSMTLEQLCDFIESIDPTPAEILQGTCATEECGNDKLASGDLCRECESEALLGEAETRYHSTGR